MELKRKPFQGIYNIIRFNWHFYLIAGLSLVSLVLIKQEFSDTVQIVIYWLVLLSSSTIIISLFASYYIYDLSDLYQITWLKDAENKKVLNIHAGFDETSRIIKYKFPNTDLKTGDFYNPKKHTELSIQRARRTYPSSGNTIQVLTNNLPFSDESFDYSLAILAAHEIRDEEERIRFLSELNRITKSNGEIMVTEHLRDWNNFMAYTIGFFHFHSRVSWLRTFEKANLKVKEEIKTTAFITTFILSRDGDTF